MGGEEVAGLLMTGILRVLCAHGKQGESINDCLMMSGLELESVSLDAAGA